MSVIISKSPAKPQPIRMLSLDAVAERVSLSKSHLRKLWIAGQFPAPVKVGMRANRWPESVVEAWLQARIASSKQP